MIWVSSGLNTFLKAIYQFKVESCEGVDGEGSMTCEIIVRGSESQETSRVMARFLCLVLICKGGC